MGEKTYQQLLDLVTTGSLGQEKLRRWQYIAELTLRAMRLDLSSVALKDDDLMAQLLKAKFNESAFGRDTVTVIQGRLSVKGPGVDLLDTCFIGSDPSASYRISVIASHGEIIAYYQAVPLDNNLRR